MPLIPLHDLLLGSQSILGMLGNNENQVLEGKGSLTPEDQSAVVEKGAFFPLDGKELGLNAASVDVTWSKAEEAALVRKLGMFDLIHFPWLRTRLCLTTL